MTISTPIKKSPSADKPEAFIEAAPDGQKPGASARTVAISLTLPDDLLADLDAMARGRKQSRAATIKLAIVHELRRDHEQHGG